MIRTKLLILCYFILGSIVNISSQELNVNPNLFGQRWVSKWIKAADAPVNDYGVYHFRKSIELHEVPVTFVIHVSADNRYKLYVNGQMVSLGPARSDIYNWAFETVDIAPFLRKGKNILAAVVWNFGEHNPVAQMSFNKTGFILQGDTENESIVNTDSSWRAIENKSYKPTTTDLNTYFVVGPGEQVNASLYPWGWQQNNYNDSSWLQAVAIMSGGGKGTLDYPGWLLVPREIPQMELTDERITELRSAEGASPIKGFPLTKKDYTIPGSSKVSLLLDQSYLTTAYLNLMFSKGKDSKITIKYAESLFNDSICDKGFLCAKGNRNDIKNKTFVGYYDQILADGGDNRQFTSLWWRTYRYISLEIETAAEPLIINDIYGTFTAYPFKKVSEFTAPQMPELDKILEVGWRTARLCAHETYEDCPYYEQLQYFGDTRIQCMISLYNTKDDRLVRNAINNGRQSIVSDGITMSRYPSNLHQFIPSFSIWWIATIYDYWMYRGNDEFVSTQLPYIRTILNFYEKHLNTDYTLSKIPHWFFTDWTNGFEYGVPPRLEDGRSSVQDLTFLMGLQLATQIEDGLGEKAMAAHYRNIANRITNGFEANYWNSSRQLFANTTLKDNFSQHTNILAILTEIVKGDKANHLMTQLLKDSDMVQSSIYFRYYLNMALSKAGMGSNYLNMLDIWKTQLSLGLTTWAEQPEPSRSDCHAWGSSPNIEVFRIVLGVKSGSSGFKKVIIEPQLGILKSAKGIIPHPNGNIEVDYKMDKSNVEAKIVLPSATDGVFIWEGKEYTLHSGEQTIVTQ